MDDGIIELNSKRGLQFGFTSDKFSTASYLWKKDNAIIISFIESLKKGNFRALVKNILDHGFNIWLPTPLGRMKDIAIKNGYIKTIKNDPAIGPFEVWIYEKTFNKSDTNS